MIKVHQIFQSEQMKPIKQSLLFIMLTATQIASRGLSIVAYNHPITKKKIVKIHLKALVKLP